MIAENILVIAEQLSLEEQIRLYKMLGGKIRPKPQKRKTKKISDITQEEANAFIMKRCFSGRGLK